MFIGNVNEHMENVMSSVIPFRYIFGIHDCKISKLEELVLESELFLHLYNNLKERYRNKYKEYFKLMKYSKYTEESMLDANYTKFLINDIISSGEYTTSGVAAYTQIPEDVVIEIACGNHVNVSVQLFQKFLELHRSSRLELYDNIVSEIIDKYMSKQK